MEGRKTRLVFREGSSNKEYTAYLEPDNVEKTSWSVFARYGIIHRTQRLVNKVEGVSYNKASEVYDKLVSTKEQRGYWREG